MVGHFVGLSASNSPIICQELEKVTGSILRATICSSKPVQCGWWSLWLTHHFQWVRFKGLRLSGTVESSHFFYCGKCVFEPASAVSSRVSNWNRADVRNGPATYLSAFSPQLTPSPYRARTTTRLICLFRWSPRSRWLRTSALHR